MDERRAVEVLRELRKHGDIADWWELDAALDHAIATIERERWRPIAEAPRVELDEVLLSNGTQAVAGCWWEGRWTTAHDEIDPQPTHWRPLPDPQPDGQEG